MEESLALQVVRAFIAKINAHTTDGLAALMTDDHRCVDTFGATGQGREVVRQLWRAHFTNVPDYKIVCKHMISEDYIIAIFGTVSGTYQHSSTKVAPQSWEVPAAWKAVVHGTRVAEWHTYYGVPPVSTQTEVDTATRDQ